MTDNQLTADGNPLCDGDHCTDPNSQLRIIPLDDSTNVHLCESCHHVLVVENNKLHRQGKERIVPNLPFTTYPCLLPEMESSI